MNPVKTWSKMHSSHSMRTSQTVFTHDKVKNDKVKNVFPKLKKSSLKMKIDLPYYWEEHHPP